ncbi:MAG TPA: hypothetical protein VFK89_04375 [Actinomycetota bacterium]|nr:hypothetical protein [Actinomycetota bacterium]
MTSFGTLSFFGAALVAFAVILVAREVSKARRRRAIIGFADTHSMDFSVYDIFDLVSRNDFPLFRTGDGRACENVVHGRWKNVECYEADFWYYTEYSSDSRRRTRRYTRFQIVVVPIEAYLPQLTVTRESMLARAAGHIGLGDINFESEEFNRQFAIKASDRAYAFKLIDARMIQWLLFLGTSFSFETSGQALLLYTRRSRPQEIGKLLEAGRQTLERIPRLIWEEYGIERTKEGPS